MSQTTNFLETEFNREKRNTLGKMKFQEEEETIIRSNLRFAKHASPKFVGME